MQYHGIFSIRCAAYDAFEWNKGRGEIGGTWVSWLNHIVNISDSYTRQLRTLARKFIA